MNNNIGAEEDHEEGGTSTQENEQQTQGNLSSLQSSPFTTQRAEELSEEELNEYREIFNLVDRDGGGSISNEELGELMDTLGINATQEEIDLMINEIDQDSNGEIDFEEFVAVMSRKVSALYTQDQVKGAFKLFEDKQKPGHIHPVRLQKLLLEYCGDTVTKEQVYELVRQLELDFDGYFNFTEYINVMMSN